MTRTDWKGLSIKHLEVKALRKQHGFGLIKRTHQVPLANIQTAVVDKFTAYGNKSSPVPATTAVMSIVQGADLEYDPAEYLLVIGPIVHDPADVVFGSRFQGSSPHRVVFFGSAWSISGSAWAMACSPC